MWKTIRRELTTNPVALYALGLPFLMGAKAKHMLNGYTTPKPFSIDRVEWCIRYDSNLAARYRDHLQRLAGIGISGRRILELGPGSDLGVGLLLLAQGARRYVGFDRHALAQNAPMSFYEELRDQLEVDLEALSDGRVSYIVRDDFDLVRGIHERFDLIISNAAFEHFDDVNHTIHQLSDLAEPGSTVLIEVDLQTHSRWIRECDPNNIYRYPEWLYRMFRFPGQPNRVRPSVYQEAFVRHGWRDVRLEPANLLPLGRSGSGYHSRFCGESMDWLSFVLCATKT